MVITKKTNLLLTIFCCMMQLGVYAQNTTEEFKKHIEKERKAIEHNAKLYKENLETQLEVDNRIKNSWTIIINGVNKNLSYKYFSKKVNLTKNIEVLDLSSEEGKSISSCDDFKKFADRKGIHQYFPFKEDVDNNGFFQFQYDSSSKEYIIDIKEYNNCLIFVPSKDGKEIILKPFY